MLLLSQQHLDQAQTPSEGQPPAPVSFPLQLPLQTHTKYATSLLQLFSFKLQSSSSLNGVASRHTHHAAVNPEVVAWMLCLRCLQQPVQHLKAPPPVLLTSWEAVASNGQVTCARVVPAAQQQSHTASAAASAAHTHSGTTAFISSGKALPCRCCWLCWAYSNRIANLSGRPPAPLHGSPALYQLFDALFQSPLLAAWSYVLLASRDCCSRCLCNQLLCRPTRAGNTLRATCPEHRNSAWAGIALAPAIRGVWRTAADGSDPQ